MTSLTIFALTSLVLIITPGPDLIYVLTRGISGGKLAGIVSAIGVSSGILVHTLAASMGLVVLLQTSAYAFWVMKLIGGSYLIYLGIQMIRNRKSIVLKASEERTDIRKCLIQGFISNVCNPKVALFFVAFLPQFIRPDVQNVGPYMVGMGIVFALMTLGFLVILGMFSGSISNWIRKKERVSEIISSSSGIILTLLGLRLLTAENK